MKSTFSRIATVAFTMWLGFAAGSANAVTSLSDWAGSDVTGYNATFSNNAVGAIFSDLFTFSAPTDSSGNGDANVVSLGGGNNVVFDSFELWEGGNMLSSGAATGTSSFLSFLRGTIPGEYELIVGGHKINGNVSGSYAGNIAVSPVPEPETYAMMLAGLGLLAFSARRRNSSVGN